MNELSRLLGITLLALSLYVVCAHVVRQRSARTTLRNKTVLASHRRGPSQHPRGPTGPPPGRIALLARGSVALAALAAWALAGPFLGLVTCAVGWWALPHALLRLQTHSDKQRSAAFDMQAPMIAELVASCLEAGATIETSLRAVGVALGPPLGEPLESAAQDLRMGGSVSEASAILKKGSSTGLGVMGSAMERSSRSGAPLAGTILDEAAAMRQQWADRTRAHARAVSVRSVLPLALCFLPAFLLLGVVPIVAGLMTSVLTG